MGARIGRSSRRRSVPRLAEGGPPSAYLGPWRPPCPASRIQQGLWQRVAGNARATGTSGQGAPRCPFGADCEAGCVEAAIPCGFHDSSPAKALNSGIAGRTGRRCLWIMEWREGVKMAARQLWAAGQVSVRQCALRGFSLMMTVVREGWPCGRPARRKSAVETLEKHWRSGECLAREIGGACGADWGNCPGSPGVSKGEEAQWRQ